MILQVGKYVDEQSELIKDGQLIPVLGKSYLAYLNSLRLALDQLYKNYSAKPKPPTLEEVIESEGKS